MKKSSCAPSDANGGGVACRVVLVATLLFSACSPKTKHASSFNRNSFVSAEIGMPISDFLTVSGIPLAAWVHHTDGRVNGVAVELDSITPELLEKESKDDKAYLKLVYSEPEHSGADYVTYVAKFEGGKLVSKLEALVTE